MSWSREWPKEKGYYWAYGYFSDMFEKPRLAVCEVRKGANSTFYVIEGAFRYEKTSGTVKFKSLPTPELPDVEK